MEGSTTSESVEDLVVSYLLQSEFDLDIKLLVDVVEQYSFDLEEEELMKMVRMLDILGAEKRWREYDFFFLHFLTKSKKKPSMFLSNFELEEIELEEKEKEKEGDMEPVSYTIHVNEIRNLDRVENISKYGSKELINYTLQRDIFMNICIIWKVGNRKMRYSYSYRK
jgi:hypothetical protein